MQYPVSNIILSIIPRPRPCLRRPRHGVEFGGVKPLWVYVRTGYRIWDIIYIYIYLCMIWETHQPPLVGKQIYFLCMRRPFSFCEQINTHSEWYIHIYIYQYLKSCRTSIVRFVSAIFANISYISCWIFGCIVLYKYIYIYTHIHIIYIYIYISPLPNPMIW